MKYFECLCHTEMLRVEHDKEYKEVDLCFYKHGHKGRQLNLWNRLRFAWRIIRTGYPYTDMVCLNYKSAKKLGEYLINETTKI